MRRFERMEYVAPADNEGRAAPSVEGHQATPPGSLCAAPRELAEAVLSGAMGTAHPDCDRALQALAEHVISLVEAVEAAVPVALRPFPVSSNERDYWRVYQQRLREKLEALNAE